MKLSEQELCEFRDLVWGYYRDSARNDLPWRQAEAGGRFDPYKIMVSEIMLQQTQASRVIPKYHEFLNRFPDVKDLAKAELADVIVRWSGLGYNRRAKYLWQSAQQIVQKYDNQVPDNTRDLMSLPGIGVNTANAIIAYSYNRPVIFIETNIRTVFIHHFFTEDKVLDADIHLLVEQTLDKENPREWYWALMDYGTHLKAAAGNSGRRSKHYVKQSAFEGSRRQLRGKVIRILQTGPLTKKELDADLADERLDGVLEDLVSESMIRKVNDMYSL